jgi:hypothetical protein
MSRQLIANLEGELDAILIKYETEHEITLAEVVGILDNLKMKRQFVSMLPFVENELRSVLEPVEAVSGPPEGQTITTFEGEDSMET